MKVKNNLPEIDVNEPFLLDKLNRAYIAENLTQLIKNIHEPFVLSINSPWGTGKTTFIRMWNQRLRNEGIPTLYFNAWESDYSEDPLLTFMSEINLFIEGFEFDIERKKVAKEYLDKAKDVSIKILKKSLPTVLKIATSGILDLDSSTGNSISNLVENIAKEKIKNYENEKKNIINFKKDLTSFVSTICTVSDAEKMPFIIFVDELDRCRPTYSIELLERIKHFLDIKGIVFVLSIDDQQIQTSIKSMYGTEMKVDGYLRRFIDLSYNLPKPNSEDFVKYLFEKFELWDVFRKRQEGYNKRVKEGDYCLESFTLLSSIFEISQRVQEQCISLINIILRTTPTNFNIHSVLLSFLIILKSFDKIMYYDFCRKLVDPKEILNLIKSRDGGSDFLTIDIGIILEAYIHSSFTSWKDFGPLIKQYAELSKKDGFNDQERYRYRRLYELLTLFATNEHHEIVNFISKKIEFVEEFNLS